MHVQCKHIIEFILDYTVDRRANGFKISLTIEKILTALIPFKMHI